MDTCPKANASVQDSSSSVEIVSESRLENTKPTVATRRSAYEITGKTVYNREKIDFNRIYDTVVRLIH